MKRSSILLWPVLLLFFGATTWNTARAEVTLFERRAIQVEMSGYSQVLFMFFYTDGLKNSEFFARRGRIKFDVRLQKRIRSVWQVDLASSPIYKDLYLQYDLGEYFSLRAGQWKMPFSRTRLTSSAKTIWIHRGPTNDAFEENNYLGRDIGFGGIVHLPNGRGKIEIGIFNGAGAGEEEFDSNKNLAGRLELHISDEFDVGIHAAAYVFDMYFINHVRSIPPETEILFAYGADALLKRGHLNFLGEFNLGKNRLLDPHGGINMMGVHLTPWYGIETGYEYIPIIDVLFKAEIFVPHLGTWDDSIVVLIPGTNVHFADNYNWFQFNLERVLSIKEKGLNTWKIFAQFGVHF